MNMPKSSIDWKKWLSVEVLALALVSAGGITVAWSDVKSDIRENTVTIQQQKELQVERYNDLKNGQRDIRHLLNQLILNIENGEDFEDGD